MKYTLFALFIGSLLALSCDSKSNSPQATTTEDKEMSDVIVPDATSADQSADTAVEDAPTTAYETVARSVNDNFPTDQRVSFTAASLAPLCTNKFGCLEEKIYPIGWSQDGKFAYLIEEANEAVMNLTLHFIIQDMETDEQLVKDTYNAADQSDFREEADRYTTQKTWVERQATYNKWITEHRISAGNGTSYVSLHAAPIDWPYTFVSNNEKKRNEMFDLEFVDRHRLLARNSSGGEKTVLNHTFGKYDFALATKALGHFQSPFEQRIALVNAFEKRGYEGPPNVLKLMVVGCKLDEGF